MIRLVLVLQNALDLACCDRILAILSMGMYELFCPWSCSQSLKGTLKPFSGFLCPSPLPQRNIESDNEITY